MRTVDGARCVLLPSTLASKNVPNSNFMSRVRMGYEHEGSISTYKIPTHMMQQGLLSIMLFETREFRDGGVPIRQIKVSSYSLWVIFLLFFFIFFPSQNSEHFPTFLYINITCISLLPTN